MHAVEFQDESMTVDDESGPINKATVLLYASTAVMVFSFYPLIPAISAGIPTSGTLPNFLFSMGLLGIAVAVHYITDDEGYKYWRGGVYVLVASLAMAIVYMAYQFYLLGNTEFDLAASVSYDPISMINFGLFGTSLLMVFVTTAVAEGERKSGRRGGEPYYERFRDK